MSKACPVCVCAMVCLLLGAMARAEGLLYRLPEDGAWARFAMHKVAKDADGADVDGEKIGSWIIKSVGRVTVADEPCRWIEIEFVADTDKSRDQRQPAAVLKFLVPEQHVGEAKDPLSHVVRAWKLRGDEKGQPKKLEEFDDLRPFLHGPYKSAEKLEPTPVDSKLGKQKCAGIRAREKTTDKRGTTHDAVYTVRLNEAAPFGVVSFDLLVKHGSAWTEHGRMTLADFGKDAISSIPDAK